MRFVIAGDGSVSPVEVANSSVDDEAVESCLRTRFFQMRFPEVRGGGVVQVTYPLMFAPR